MMSGTKGCGSHNVVIESYIIFLAMDDNGVDLYINMNMYELHILKKKTYHNKRIPLNNSSFTLQPQQDHSERVPPFSHQVP